MRAALALVAVLAAPRTGQSRGSRSTAVTQNGDAAGRGAGGASRSGSCPSRRHPASARGLAGRRWERPGTLSLGAGLDARVADGTSVVPARPRANPQSRTSVRWRRSSVVDLAVPKTAASPRRRRHSAGAGRSVLIAGRERGAHRRPPEPAAPPSPERNPRTDAQRLVRPESRSLARLVFQPEHPSSPAPVSATPYRLKAPVRETTGCVPALAAGIAAAALRVPSQAAISSKSDCCCAARCCQTPRGGGDGAGVRTQGRTCSLRARVVGAAAGVRQSVVAARPRSPGDRFHTKRTRSVAAP